MNIFANAGIGRKLTLGFGFTLVLLLATIALFYTSLGTVLTSYNTLMENEVETYQLSHIIDDNLLQGRRREKDFLLRKDMKYYPRVEKHIKKLQNATSDLVEVARKFKKTQLLKDCREIQTQSRLYLEGFNQVVKSWQVRGLAHNVGLQGAFRKTIHSLESELKGFDIDQIYLKCAQWRKAESDCLGEVTRDRLKQLRARFLAYHKVLEDSQCPSQVKAAQANWKKAYLAELAKCKSADKIGKIAVEVQGKMRELSQKCWQSLATAYLPGSSTLMLQIRRAEKDYLLRDLAKYIDKVKNYLLKFHQMIDQSKLTLTYRNSLKQKLDDYLKKFLALVAENEKIKTHTANMRKAAHAIEPLVARIMKQSQTSLDKQSAATTSQGFNRSRLALTIGLVAILFGALAAWFIVTSISRPLSSCSTNLDKASLDLTALSDQLSSITEETSSQASLVSSAAEQINQNVQSVAVGAEQLSTNVKDVALGANQASRVAQEGSAIARATNDVVNKLSESSTEIGQVIKVITSIAQQTNLLALNATIEAARAGEAGKGFAVVASEVKELARETARATEDIQQKIGNIQEDAQEAVGSIGKIARIIDNINQTQASIASSVEEQTATTNEIARSVNEVARGTSEIAKNISGVAEGAKVNASSANSTQSAARNLSEMSSQLQKLIGRRQRD